jgi:hypothetical protein
MPRAVEELSPMAGFGLLTAKRITRNFAHYSNKNLEGAVIVRFTVK